MLHRYEPSRMAPHRARRQQILETLSARQAAALIPSARPKARNADTEHRYRPDSDFWRLTGFGEPHAALLLLPKVGERAARSVLFLRPRDREQEIWSGLRLGVERACEALGVDEARPIEQLWKDLPTLLEGCTQLCYRTGVDAANDAELLATLTRMRAKPRSPLPWPQELFDTAPLLHEARLFKDAAELSAMRRAAEITAAGHAAALRIARPGVNEREVEARMEYEFRRLGADAPAYNSIVAGGANACVLHYVENDAPLADGELLLIDAGAEFEHYACDVTRTFPVGRRFSAEQRALYDVVLRAQLAALAIVRTGTTIDQIHQCALRALVEGLCEHKLLAESVDEALASGSYKRFYMHRTSHWLGLDVHDGGAYVRDGASRALEPSMVITVEPGLYVAPDEASVEPRWRGIGIRIEDDVLVTAGGSEVLTAAIPKQADALEELRREALQSA
jgi:Xaa-Pro aminopeptidase